MYHARRPHRIDVAYGWSLEGRGREGGESMALTVRSSSADLAANPCTTVAFVRQGQRSRSFIRCHKVYYVA